MNRTGLNSAEIRFQIFQIFRGKLISMLNHHHLNLKKHCHKKWKLHFTCTKQSFKALTWKGNTLLPLIFMIGVHPPSPHPKSPMWQKCFGNSTSIFLCFSDSYLRHICIYSYTLGTALWQVILFHVLRPSEVARYFPSAMGEWRESVCLLMSRNLSWLAIFIPRRMEKDVVW